MTNVKSVWAASAQEALEKALGERASEYRIWHLAYNQFAGASVNSASVCDVYLVRQGDPKHYCEWYVSIAQ